MRKEPIVIGLFAVVAVAGWALLELRHAGSGQADKRPQPPGNIAVASSLLANDERLIETLTWEQIPQAAYDLGDWNLQTKQFMAKSAPSGSGPVLYLRALLELGRNQPEEALREFSKIDPAAIPAALLYAPWRLWQTARPDEASPFDAPFFAAADAGHLDGLLTARADARRGKFKEALQRYLETDPAAWASVDVENFRAMMADEAFRNEAGTVLLAAFKGGKLPEAIRASAASLLLGQAPAEGVDPARVAEFFNANPEAVAIAEETVRSLSEDRRLFAEEKFPDLVAKHAEGKPDALIDETVILLTIASSATGDKEAFGRWSQELSRRFPQPEVTSWIESLANP